MEEIQVADGRVRNPSFTDYLIPTILDMPPMRLDVLELADPQRPVWPERRGRAADDLLHARGGRGHPRRHRPGADPGPGPARAHHRDVTGTRLLRSRDRSAAQYATKIMPCGVRGPRRGRDTEVMWPVYMFSWPR